MLPRFVRAFLLIHGCNHNLQWFWSPRKSNLSLFPLSPIYLPWSEKVKVKSLSRAQLFATPWLRHPWDFPGKSTGVGCHFLLQGIFPTQGSNPGLLHCRQTLYHLSHQGIIALCNLMKLCTAWLRLQGEMGQGGEFWQNMVHWRREWKSIPVFLPRESHEQ